jgi:hypothetical protein
VTNFGLAWMQTITDCPGPALVNLCGVSGGTITMSPGPFREAVLANPAGATFLVSQLTAGP